MSEPVSHLPRFIIIIIKPPLQLFDSQFLISLVSLPPLHLYYILINKTYRLDDCPPGFVFSQKFALCTPIHE